MMISAMEWDGVRSSTSTDDSMYPMSSISYNPKPIHRCNTFPLRLKQEQNNSYYFDSGTKKDMLSEESESEEEKGSSVSELSSSLPKQNYLDVPRSYVKGRALSLPTSAPLINVSDLSRLQSIYEKGKSKKGNNGNRGGIGKSMLNRLTKKLSSTNDDSKSHVDCKDSADQAASSPRIAYRASTGGMPEAGSPGFNKKNHRKLFDRRGSAQLMSIETKSKPSRMGQKIRRTFTSGDNNLLQHAVAHKDVEMLDKLLVHKRYQEEINYLEPPGVSVFHQACVYGEFIIVQLLINKGADVTLQTWMKLSPLKIAVMFGHYEIAELLLNSGADINDIRNGF